MRARVRTFARLSLAAALVAAVAGIPAPARAAASLTVDIGDATVLEGNVKVRNVYVPITLTSASTAELTVEYHIQGVTATGGTLSSGADFNNKGGVSKTLTFKVGGSGKTAVKKQVTIPVYPDASVEGNETFEVHLFSISGPGAGSYSIGRGTGTVTIVDDDPSSGVTASIGDATMVEGDVGKRGLQFTIALSQPATTQVSVDLAVASGPVIGGATCGPTYYGSPVYPDTDCAETSKTVTFKLTASGFTGSFKVYSATLFPDTDIEGDETFTVTLSNPVGLTIADGTGVGTIIDDDD
jgi:chitinase